mgnify:CR=1 FL=1|tara:strand:- start:5684 stop:7003 length:1320 start_codon:yes stop_codon:yes gene_type:complete
MNKPTLILSCPIDTYSGYGSRGRDIAKSLIELDKYDIKILPQRWGNTPWGFIEDHNEWKFLNNHIINQPQHITKPDIWVQLTIPNEFIPQGKYNIGITAGIETTACPPEWINGCNRMDLVLGSSEHSIKVFKECKFQKTDKNTGQIVDTIELSTKTEVLFEGLNLDIYKPIKSTLDLSGIKESFCYLFVGHWIQGDLGHDRKNIGLLIKSFCETFKNKSPQPALILKTSHGSVSQTDKERTLQKIKSIKSLVKGKLPNIYLLYGEFSDQEINELYNHSKVKAMVSLTKGEGFGRPLLEFTQSKKPIITTGWSGHTDFLKPGMSVLLPGVLGDIHSSVKNDWFIEGAKWFDVNVNILSKTLKDTYKKYKSFLQGSKEQAKHSKENFSYEKMKEKLNSILINNVPNFPTEVKLDIPEISLVSPKKIDSLKLNLPNIKIANT